MGIKTLFCKISFAFLLSFYFIASTSAAVITSLNDDFEGENLIRNYTGFQNWNVLNGTVDTVGPNFLNTNCQGSLVCVDLDGSTGNSGILSTINEFAIDSYILKFDLSGSRRGGSDTVSVSLGDYTQSITMASNDPWQTFQETVSVNQLSKLTFENQGGDNIGLLLDNVSVTPVVTAPVSIPSTILLLGVALTSLISIRRAS